LIAMRTARNRSSAIVESMGRYWKAAREK